MNKANRAGESIYAKAYLIGWILPVAFFAAPIATYADVSIGNVAWVLTIIVAGYVVSALTGASAANSQHNSEDFQRRSRLLLRVAIVFSILSLIGGQLVLMEQSNFLGTGTFDDLQERYIALIQSSLEETATHSVWSTIGNLMRSIFFVAIASLVVYTKIDRSFLRRVAISCFVGAALLQSFFVNISRLQFVFYLIYAAVVAYFVGHPILKRVKLLITAAVACSVFLIVTTDQRISNTFADSSAAADYMAAFFGVDLQPWGQDIVEHLGLSTLVLVIYFSESIPEFIRLMIYNHSPYALGAHSFFPVLSPLARIIEAPLKVDMSAISNQGLWWGFLGDLYIDFGAFYFVAYLFVLFVMIRVARGFAASGIFGLSFRALTVSMILIIPFTGIFNTYSVSYVLLLIFALLEKKTRYARPRPVTAFIGTRGN